MSAIMIILLVLDAVLLIALFGYVAVRAGKEDEAVYQTEQVAEVVPEVVEQAPATVVEETVVVEEVVAPVVEEVAATDADDDVEADEADDIERAKRIPFAEKLLALDEKVQGYYDELNNKFKSLRKINTRVSVKGVSYRLGRELVAKITVRGKTMKLHLALDVNNFEDNIYFQKDLSDVKAYAEVPFTVKVKSDRGAKNAIKLIDALAAEKGIESKVRFNQVDSIAQLKDIIVESVISENK